MAKIKSTAIAKVASREELQNSVKKEIERIDEKLASLGLPPNIVYNIPSAISNFETNQNTVGISSCTDLNYLYRALGYYTNMYDSILERSKAMFGVANTEVRNQNNQLIRHIIADIELRIRIITNSTTINTLNQAKAKLTPFLDEDTKLINTIKEVEALYKSLK